MKIAPLHPQLVIVVESINKTFEDYFVDVVNEYKTTGVNSFHFLMALQSAARKKSPAKVIFGRELRLLIYSRYVHELNRRMDKKAEKILIV